MDLYLTCDIGGTDLKYGIIDISSNLITKGSVSTHAKEGGRAILDQIVEIYNNHKNDYNIKGIAISSAGVVDPNTTIILDATNTITNFIGLNIREYLNEKLGNINISVENDVNCMALCEAFKGSGVNAKSMAAMTIGTGIGGAIVIDGNLIHGNGYSAGEWGNMYINGLVYEKQASTRALVLEAKKINNNIKNGVDVFTLYDDNDPLIKVVVNNFFEALSSGIANIIYSLNPEKFVIGGGITARGAKFIEELKTYVKPKLSPYIYSKTEIVIAEHKNDAGMLGAFENYKKHFINK
jgi:predicted NBD/HSP70 family sugar kinase